MIISNSNKFIFVKTRKTAGTSIELMLSDFCTQDDVLTPIAEDDQDDNRARNYQGKYLSEFDKNNSVEYMSKNAEKLYEKNMKYINHMPAAMIRDRIGEETWGRYFTFCFERNPWDRVVSLYHYRKDIKKEIDLDFDNFVKQGMIGGSNYQLYAYSGEVIVDKIYKYEELNQALENIAKTLKLDIPKKLDIHAKKSDKRKRKYRSYYNNQTREIVENKFIKEITLHDYKF